MNTDCLEGDWTKTVLDFLVYGNQKSFFPHGRSISSGVIHVVNNPPFEFKCLLKEKELEFVFCHL